MLMQLQCSALCASGRKVGHAGSVEIDENVLYNEETVQTRGLQRDAVYLG
jgi:hypothetical protein